MYKIFFFLSILLINPLEAFVIDFSDGHISIGGLEKSESLKLFEKILGLVYEQTMPEKTDQATSSMLDLIDNGYEIKHLIIRGLIGNLKNEVSTNNATQVLIKSIEHNGPLNFKNQFIDIIDLTDHKIATDNVALILLTAIEQGYEFSAVQLDYLIGSLQSKIATNNATLVLLKIIEFNYHLNFSKDNWSELILSLNHKVSSKNAAIILKGAIDAGYEFSGEERDLLYAVAEEKLAKKNALKVINALKSP